MILRSAHIYFKNGRFFFARPSCSLDIAVALDARQMRLQWIFFLAVEFLLAELTSFSILQLAL